MRLVDRLLPHDGFTTTQKWVWGAIAAIAIVLGVGRCAFPGDTIVDGEGILGVYTVNGVDPLGIEYSGTVTIAPTDEPDIVAIEWIVTGGIQEGTGRLDGNTLSVDWRTVSAATETSGTGIYTIGPDGVLTGERTTVGTEGVGTEEIFPAA
jgi:hypothetical protein